MSDETTELVPCPWCGVDIKLHAINYPWADGEPGWNIWHDDMDKARKKKCPMVMGCYDTREEAIVAWNTSAELGSEPPYDELLRCLENDWHISASWDGLRKFWCIELTEEGMKLRDAMNGTLTAEQVRKVIMSADRWEKPMGDTGLTNTHLIIRDDGWQAIADELNVELGNEREKQLEKLVSDLWQSHECGAGCAMYEECRHPLDDRCPMEERVAELGSGTCEFIPTAGNPPTCSNCGWQADTYDCEWLDGGAYEYDGRFCKHCGAQVRKAVER